MLVTVIVSLSFTHHESRIQDNKKVWNHKKSFFVFIRINFYFL